MPFKTDKINLWEHGVVLSFDLDTASLKKYFSKTSPHGAYDVVKRFLKNNGFKHKKDSDYVNENIGKIAAVDLLVDFTDQNKWFPLCVNKMNISPNVAVLDISEELKQLADEDWQKQKDEENKK